MIKSSFLAAVAALFVSTVAIGSAVAPAQAVTLPIRITAHV